MGGGGGKEEREKGMKEGGREGKSKKLKSRDIHKVITTG